MHRCPQCGYAFGPITGIPADRFGVFTADVKCPECGFHVPAGSRIIAGSSTAEGAQPLTRRRRLRQLAVGMLPMLFLLQYGLRGLANVISQGPRSASAFDLLGVALLAFPCLVLWSVWKHWKPQVGEDGTVAAIASRDVRWVCMPGALVVYFGSLSTWSGGPVFRMDAAGNLRPTVTARGATRIDLGNLRSIRVHAPAETGSKRRAGERIVATIVAVEWVTDKAGVRKDMKSWSINIDTGGEAGPPGTDRASAAVEAGERVANLIRESLGLPRRSEAPTATAVYGADPEGAPIVVDGSRYALLPLEERMTEVGLLLTLPMLAALPGPIVGILALVDRFRQATGNQAVGPTIGPVLGTYITLSILLLAALAPLWWYLRRRAIRQQETRCRWEVGHVGLRVTESECDRAGNVRRETVHDVPTWEIERVGVVTTKRRIRLVASNHKLKEVASVVLDELPEGGAEALAERIRARLGKSVPG